MALDDTNLEELEVGVTLADLDSSCSGSLSEGEQSARECSLNQHGLPPLVIGCITHVATSNLKASSQLHLEYVEFLIVTS